jgi:cobalt-zinc-cadmium efflux system protein
MTADQLLDKSIAGRFRIAIVLTSLTLAIEVAGGIWTGSLALLSDAAHVFLDLFALLLSLAAIRLAAYPASDTRTYGWHRTEVFASFINGSTVFLMATGIFYEAWQRFQYPQEIKGLPMLVIAVAGLLLNLFSASALHAHSHDDLNVQSAFLHVIGDAAASVGVIAGAAVIYFTNWYLVDAIISAGIGVVIFWGSWRVIRDSAHILLEGVPRGMSTAAVADAIKSVAGVNDVHHLNLWAICSHIIALSGHLDVAPEYRGKQAEVLRRIEELLFERFHISHTTLQVECTLCVDAPVIKNLRHRQRREQSARHSGHSHGHDHHEPHEHDH